MDPNANLEELRRLVADALVQLDAEDTISAGSAARAFELISALDGWLSKGGFLPHAWAPVAITAAPADFIPTRPTRAKFLAAYRAKMAMLSWAHVVETFNTFMREVERTLAGEATSWHWNSPLARETWIDIGGKGRMTLKALRALP